MLKLAGVHHFKNYWHNMPRFIKPLALEEKYECDFPYEMYANNPLNIQKIRLQGKFDRVDIRCSEACNKIDSSESATSVENISWENEHWIIDYKTGHKISVKEAVWKNTDLWGKIYAINALVVEKTKTPQHVLTIQEEIDLHTKKDLLLKEIAERMHTIQLPFYLYVYGLCVPHVRCNAAWIFLAEEKQEVSLITLKASKNEKDTKKNDNSEKYAESWHVLDCIKNTQMPQLLTFLINHLLHAHSFKHCEGKACLYCPHKEYC